MDTILVVDDSPMEQRIIGGYLENLGLEAVYAKNGSEALVKIAQSPLGSSVAQHQAREPANVMHTDPPGDSGIAGKLDCSSWIVRYAGATALMFGRMAGALRGHGFG